MNGIIEMLQVYYSNYIDNERAGVVSAVQKNQTTLKDIPVSVLRGKQAESEAT